MQAIEARAPAARALEDQRFFASQDVKCAYNAFWSLPRLLPQRLPVPDLLHGVYLGLLKYLMEWIKAFLKKHGRTQTFDTVWVSFPAYPGLARPTKPYRQLSQWQGK